MADISVLELDALWAEFHSVVNMTSEELSAWLTTAADADDGDTSPARADSATGERVLAILRKRRTDLTDEDVRVMYAVVDAVEAERDGDSPSGGGGRRSRDRLMMMGHDPRRAG
jgi:hypothetical protein